MESLMKYIGRTFRLAVAYRTYAFKPLGLGGEQHPYILHVCRTPGITQDELARRIVVNKSNVARQLSSLEEKGFITRSPSPEDKRQSLVYPTGKAIEVVPRIRAILDEWNQALVQDLTEDGQEQLIQVLKSVVERATGVVEALPDDGTE